LEERANKITQIEEQVRRTGKLVDAIEGRIGKGQKYFLQMNVKEKLQRRAQETGELYKRVEALQNGLNEVEVDLRTDFNKLQINNEMAAIEVFEEIFRDVEQFKEDHQAVGNKLLEIEQEVAELRGDRTLHQFDLLKGNLRIKKKILEALQEIKGLKQLYG